MEVRILRRNKKSNKNRAIIRRLDCQSIDHPKFKKLPPCWFKVSMNEFMLSFSWVCFQTESHVSPHPGPLPRGEGETLPACQPTHGGILLPGNRTLAKHPSAVPSPRWSASG